MTKEEFNYAYDNGYQHGYAAGRSECESCNDAIKQPSKVSKPTEEKDVCHIALIPTGQEERRSMMIDVEEHDKWKKFAVQYDNPSVLATAALRRFREDVEAGRIVIDVYGTPRRSNGTPNIY